MTPRIRSSKDLPRIAVAAACSLALALPTAAQARAQDPEPEASGELTPQAQQHVVKAYQHYQGKAYAQAESELRRAAFFAPKWRPLHFNLAVMAEAQGKLGTAITEYKAFQPLAVADEALVAEQRIVELDSRRRKIAGAYRQQIAIGAITMSVGVAGTGAGVGLLVYGFSIPKETPTYGDDPLTTDVIETDYQTGTTSNSSKRTTFVAAGYLAGLVGVLILVGSIVPLRKAVKAKRQLDGLALGPTRLRLTSNGVALRF